MMYMHMMQALSPAGAVVAPVLIPAAPANEDAPGIDDVNDDALGIDGMSNVAASFNAVPSLLCENRSSSPLPFDIESLACADACCNLRAFKNACKSACFLKERALKNLRIGVS